MHVRSATVVLLLLAATPAIASDDVRTLLADHCFRCHGPDAAAREADLRLDTRAGLFGKATEGHVVVAGKPDESELVRRITSDDPEVRMPPPDAKKPLTDAEIERLRRWVADGAEWSGHWAFTPPQRPDLPPIGAWGRNAIDGFVQQRLQREGLEPSAAASREALIRRVTLDLTGLPPTPAEVDRFLADRSPDAYERVVDRLLASPRYGERMAVAWLDAARYADTSGYQFDGPRDMWRWRDWVIDALNANRPFDEFSIEQLAGDLLPKATLEQRIATGFHRNHRGNSEGGIVPEEYAVEYVVDRVDTTATVWLGLTLGCARCHDHKYDPLTQREYYQLFDYFNDVPEHGRAIKEGNSPPYITAPTVEQYNRQIALLIAKLKAVERWGLLRREVDAARRTWTGTLDATNSTDWTITDGLAARFTLADSLKDTIEPRRTASVAGEAELSATGVVLKGGYLAAPDAGAFGYFDPFTVSAWVKPDSKSGGIVSRMSDDSYSDGWAMHLEDGRVQGLFVKRWLDDSLRVETEQRLKLGVWQHVAMTYDGSRTAEGVRILVDGELWEHRVLLDALNQSFVNEEPLRIGSTGTKRRFRGVIRDVRVYDRVLEWHEQPVLAADESIEALAALGAGRRTHAQDGKLHAYFLTRAAPAKIREAWSSLRRADAELKEFGATLPTVMVMEQMDPPRPSFVLKRGEYDKPGEQVETGVPAVLSEATTTEPGEDRLGLARWLFDPANPLTARVAVNREWQRLFGRGLVETSEDFGTQGSPPSHPELLDWLATEFVRTGWDVKRLQRLIVTSATYRQASAVSPVLLERDPNNRLLARGPRFRLSAEAVRDQALAAAGLLVERVGGPSVKPYQPPGLWADVASAGKYVRDSGPDLYRRSVYSFKKRTVANPTMAVLDATTRESCLVRRSRTNTSLAALALLNDVTFVEAARVLAERALRREGTDADRVAWTFRRVLGRNPSTRELAVLTRALARRREHFAADPDAARRLASTGEFPTDPDVAADDVAAFTTVASLILNLDETVTRR